MAVSVHGTLAAGVVQAVTVDAGSAGFEVVNRDTIGEIWVRLDGVDPVAEADGTFVVLGSRRFPGSQHAKPVTVRLLSTAARRFSVEGFEG